MLPGFRVLFALVVLSFAILVFGFGAVALLRTAHDSFAGQPTWRTPTDTLIPPNDRQTTLALLRVDPPGQPDQPAKAPASIDDANRGREAVAVEAPKVATPPNDAAGADKSTATDSTDQQATAAAPIPTDSPAQKQVVAAIEQPAHPQSNETATEASASPPKLDAASPVAATYAANAKAVEPAVPNSPAEDAAAKVAAVAPGSPAERTGDTGEAQAAQEPPLAIAALPEGKVPLPLAAPSQAARDATADEQKLLARRLAHARYLRARRLAAARARAAAPLAQTTQPPFGSTYPQTTSQTQTTKRAAPSPSTLATTTSVF